MSIFDASTCGIVELGKFVWMTQFLFVFFFVGVMYFVGGGRFLVILELFLDLVRSMVMSSKLMVISGSGMMLSALFLLMFFCNFTGLLPFVMSVSSHLVFSMCFGLTFWLSLVLSSLVMGKLYTSMSKLVFAGLPVAGGMILCWMEKLSIFFRWFTLSLRLVANMTVGQIASASVSGLLLNAYFGMSSFYVFLIVMMLGVGLLLVELAVSFIQAYLFCLLLSVYSDDHSL